MIVLDWCICDSPNLKLIVNMTINSMYILRKILVSDLLLISEYYFKFRILLSENYWKSNW